MWSVWEHVEVAGAISSGKTVWETLWPRVMAIAAREGWTNWVDRMAVALGNAIIRAKNAEFPTLERNSEVRDAVFAGELWASAAFHEGVARFDRMDTAVEWLLRHARLTPQRPLVPLGLAAVSAHAHVARFLPAQFDVPANVVRVEWNTITFDALIIYLYLGSFGNEPTTLVLQSLVHYVSGMSKLGNMSEAWRRSRVQQIRRETASTDLEIERAVATRVWDMYGVAYSPKEKFEELFAYIGEKCRAKGLTRLFVTAQQSAAQGCTVLTLVRDAMREVAEFNWARFAAPKSPAERAIGAELAMWRVDYDAMIQNPWIRFGSDVGRSPQMANLGYLAKSLLSRARGVTSLDRYSGLDMGNLVIRYRTWIDRQVGRYITDTATFEQEQEKDIPARAAEDADNPMDERVVMDPRAAAIPRAENERHIPVVAALENYVLDFDAARANVNAGQGGQGGARD